MRKITFITTALLVVSVSGLADNQFNGDKMVNACRSEIKSLCSGKTNAEFVWKCIEDKSERDNKPISKQCREAHEQYESVYHTTDNFESTSRKPAADKN